MTGGSDALQTVEASSDPRGETRVDPADGLVGDGSIGDALRAARERRGLSQGYVAAFLNVGRTQLVNVEGGRFMPSVATVEEAADALNATLVYRPHLGWGLVATEVENSHSQQDGDA